MEFDLSPEQRDLQAQARAFLDARFPLERVAQLADSELGWDPGSWQELVDLGWLAISAPESQGGAGLGFMEEALVLEELGRCLYPGPFLATVALALPALDDTRRAEVIAGKRRWSAALGFGDLAVPDLDRVDRVVVLQNGELLDMDARGERLASIDPTRTLGRLRADGGEPLHRGAEAARIAERMRLRLFAGLAMEAVGGGQRVLELGLAHARDRQQFGRPIGAYQAVSHRLADCYVELELARSLAYWASWCLSVDHQDASLAASAAKAAAAEAYVGTCERTIQVLGGMGFTWESPLHRHYKRALWVDAFAGRPSEHRRRVALQLGLTAENHPLRDAPARQEVAAKPAGPAA
ncbi:MAG: acyl-CoA dehydrogenase family protein [Candidatus Dormibacteria bacterium]